MLHVIESTVKQKIILTYFHFAFSIIITILYLNNIDSNESDV